MTRPRTGARLAAVQAVFQSEQAGENTEAVIEQFLIHRLGARPDGASYEDGRVPEVDIALFERIVRWAAREQERIDRMVVEALPKEWPFARLDPVLRAVLRAGGAELAMATSPPARVIINEYLDVAHGFFTGDEPRMANGMLDHLARTLRAGEFSA